MPQEIIPNVVEIVLEYSTGAGLQTNRLYAQAIGEQSVPELSTIAGDMLTSWQANIQPELSSDMFLSRIVVTDKNTTNQRQYTLVTGGLAGGSAGPIAPVNSALGLVKDTGFVGRAYRGYLYQGGLRDVDTTGGSINTPKADAIALGWRTVLNDFNLTGNPLVHVQRNLNGQVVSPPASFPIIDFYYANTKIATIGRRIGK